MNQTFQKLTKLALFSTTLELRVQRISNYQFHLVTTAQKQLSHLLAKMDNRGPKANTSQ